MNFDERGSLLVYPKSKVSVEKEYWKNKKHTEKIMKTEYNIF